MKRQKWKRKWEINREMMRWKKGESREEQKRREMTKKRRTEWGDTWNKICLGPFKLTSNTNLFSIQQHPHTLLKENVFLQENKEETSCPDIFQKLSDSLNVKLLTITFNNKFKLYLYLLMMTVQQGQMLQNKRLNGL